MSLVAGVDSSTQSTSVVLRDADTGAVIGRGSAPHPPTTPPISEQDPRAWWSALTQAMQAARADAGVDPADITAISVAAQCHGLVVLDEHDDVIRPAKLWNDTTSSPQQVALEEQIGTQAWIRRVGSLPTAAFTLTKLAWLAANEPDQLARTRRVLLPHDWLTYVMTGRAVTDRSDASGTGYYDAARDEYAPELLALVDPDRDWTPALPEVLGPQEAAGTIRPDAAAQLGVSPRAVVGPGAGDQHAGALGIGLASTDTGVSLGTSGVVFTTGADPVYDLTGRIDGVANATGGFLPLASTLNAAKVTDTIGRILGADHARLAALAAGAARTADRPVLAAYLDGERTPNLPHARGTLTGLTSATTPEQIALAAYEGVIFGLAEFVDQLTDLGLPQTGRIVAVGGGARSVTYLQTLATTLGRDVHTVPETEIVAAGAAAQAAAVLHGTTAEAQAAAWAPEATVAASPTPDPTLPTVRDRYRTASGWRGADITTA